MVDLDLKKLDKLLSYWKNHNKQHTQEMEKWIERIKKSFSEEIVQDLTNVIQLFEQMNTKFDLIKQKLEQDRDTSIGQKTEKKKKVFPKWNRSETIFELKEIGVIHTPYKDNAPYQPVEKDQGEFQIILNPQYQEGLNALEKFRYIFVIYYIHQLSRDNQNIVSPPWTNGYEVGIFASRSPLRPNPIGISIVKIKEIVDNKIYTSGLDVFDGTPLLDIKPYIKDLDSKEDANYGWIENLEGFEHLLLHIKGIPHDY